MEQQHFQNATVIKQTGSLYRLTFLPRWEPFTAILSGRLRLEKGKLTNPVAVGDRVNGFWQPGGNHRKEKAVITQINPRVNYLIRKSVNLSRQAHIIAANIDRACVILSATEPKTPFPFIDRFLVTCQAYSVPATIILNKTDQLEWAPQYRSQAGQYRDVYQRAGYTVMEVSARTGAGIEPLSELLKGKISLLSGISGVGKSALANRLDPKLKLKTAPISLAHMTGKHTTTYYEMHPLGTGGYIIDSPGIKGFGLLEMTKEELSHYFPEIFAASASCRFNSCLHAGEPDCAVRDAVEEGLIPAERYDSYLKMLEDPEGGKYRT
ncbi:MAG TPA: ribosome small subunit-dependent GTPase A [Bacteroidales bacterium]|nr:MAG: putative ribosome biogenesis GTPase RsgA [Bacteroidetes bacterium ADurb.Bin139]HOG24652.1 ribosome small subunit-dependent GTPase A [Bacteroidales bacterium]HOR11390.1 ribosome small subunit-dependent GTPase A [Bacteroidales bacterium]HOZ18868.1 ribosome small subunit-dependent GTPase A [Bacteroidales bacterium]HPB77583.1 ribosome small subunit-dependent GTPase A [Bacteroidales bacterium]